MARIQGAIELSLSEKFFTDPPADRTQTTTDHQRIDPINNSPPPYSNGHYCLLSSYSQSQLDSN
jgi:hypothetical protein